MEYLIYERRHANGATGRIYRDDQGGGYLGTADPLVGPGPDTDDWPYVDTIGEAEAAADAAAHPGCTGDGCGRWVVRMTKERDLPD
jgi:hypothetical protein